MARRTCVVSISGVSTIRLGTAKRAHFFRPVAGKHGTPISFHPDWAETPGTTPLLSAWGSRELMANLPASSLRWTVPRPGGGATAVCGIYPRMRHGEAVRAKDAPRLHERVMG